MENEDLQKLFSGQWGKVITEECIQRYRTYLNSTEHLKDTNGIDLTTIRGAVLLKEDIVSLSDRTIRKLPLIDPLGTNEFDRLLKPASYQLRLGSHYRVDDTEGYLSLDKPTLTIPRHGIAIVSTLEWLNIPTFLIGRWNLRVHRVYDGLVWVGGPQVDPGYQGFLFCPLYNLSNSDQTLTYGRGLFTIDFELTTHLSQDKVESTDSLATKRLWKAVESRNTFTFNGLDTQRIKSAPKEQFKEMDSKISNAKEEIRRFEGIVYSILGVIIAAVAIIATLNSASGWNPTSSPIILSIFAIVISLLALFTAIFCRIRN
jgi:deoxycytidine triphosphate deaminase